MIVVIVIVVVVFVKVKLGLKIFWSKSNSCPKKCWIQKKYASKKGFKSQNVLIKKLRLKRIKVQKNFGSKKIWGPKNFESNKFRVQKFWVKWSGSKNKKSNDKWKFPLKFGQIWVGNSWAIPDLDKCHQDKCWLDKYYNNGWHLLKIVPGTYL